MERLETYMHIHNGGVTVGIEGTEQGPTLFVEASHFGNQTNGLRTRITRNAVHQLAAMFARAAENIDALGKPCGTAAGDEDPSPVRGCVVNARPARDEGADDTDAASGDETAPVADEAREGTLLRLWEMLALEVGDAPAFTQGTETRADRVWKLAQSIAALTAASNER